MPLVRMTDKRLAANRANAQKSTGPRTPEGKARTALNACKHHLYARTHIIPDIWHDRIAAQVIAATAELADDQTRRELHANFVYLELWSSEVCMLRNAYIDQTIAACNNDVRRGLHTFHVKTPIARAFHKRLRHIHFRILEADRDITRYERQAAKLARLPIAQYTAPKTLAAGAGAPKNPPSAEPTRNSLIPNALPTPSITTHINFRPSQRPHDKIGSSPCSGVVCSSPPSAKIPRKPRSLAISSCSALDTSASWAPEYTITSTWLSVPC